MQLPVSSGKGGDSGKGDNAGSLTTNSSTSHPPSTYKACNPSNCKGTPGYYTTSRHQSLSLMDHLDALVQIHTNAQLGQILQSQGQILQSQGQILQIQSQLAQSQGQLAQSQSQLAQSQGQASTKPGSAITKPGSASTKPAGH